MENILSRINKLIDNERISIGIFEQKIGTSKNVIKRAIEKNTDIQAKWLPFIVKNYPKYSAEWLLTGEGKMLKSEQAGAAAPAICSDASTQPMSDDIRKLRDEIDRLTQEIWLQRKEIAEIREFLKTKL